MGPPVRERLGQSQMHAYASAISWWDGGDNDFPRVFPVHQSYPALFLRAVAEMQEKEKKYASACLKFAAILLAKENDIAKPRISVGEHYQRTWVQKGMTNWSY